MSNSSIWPIDKTLSGATTLGQSRPGSNGNERVLRIPQSSSITGATPSDCLVSYYSAAPANRARWGRVYPSARIIPSVLVQKTGIQLDIDLKTPFDMLMHQWKLDTGNKNNRKCTCYLNRMQVFWQKCSGNCMCGMLEGSVIMHIV